MNMNHEPQRYSDLKNNVFKRRKSNVIIKLKY